MERQETWNLLKLIKEKKKTQKNIFLDFKENSKVYFNRIEYEERWKG